MTGAWLTDAQFVANKTKAALDGGVGVILCCGESLEVTLSPHPDSCPV